MTSQAEQAGDRRAGETDASWQFGAFSLLFACSLILHQLWWGGFEVLSPHFAVVVAALWSATRPRSVARFVTMIATEVVSVALDMPGVGSHTVLVLVSGACVLAFVGLTALRTRRLPGAGALYAGIAPFLRMQLLLVYAAAALAKLNTGFLDGEFSCAAWMSSRIAWFDPSLLDASWRIMPAVWGTVVIELSLPVLLAVPRTRMAGLALGGGFHAILALAGNVPFSALAVALYVAFLPGDTPSRLRELLGRHAWLGRWAGRARRSGASLPAFGIGVAGWLAAAAVFSVEPAAGRAVVANGTRLVLVGGMLVAGILLGLCMRQAGPPAHPSRSLRLGHPIFVAGILALLANAASPYLGFKTESSFTMFSNLQTEPGHWNHAFIPEAVRVLGYQDHLVRIIRSNDPVLEARGRGGRRLVRRELERYLRARPSARVSYAASPGRGGAVLRTAEAGAGTALLTPVVDKIAKFRDVRAPGRPGC